VIPSRPVEKAHPPVTRKKKDSSFFKIELQLEDGTVFKGTHFGHPRSVSGEVVFNTGMVGYPESLTDPSYKGEILVFTYPLIGNYGVPGKKRDGEIETRFESDAVQVEGLVVSEFASRYSHWNAGMSLGEWLEEHRIPGVYGVDTRKLTRHLREKGAMPGRIVFPGEEVPFRDPNKENLVSLVSVKERFVYGRGKKRVALVDCGCKNHIVQSLLARDVTVVRVPWDCDFTNEGCDGVLISNGPGNPVKCTRTVENVRKAMAMKMPVFGICLGNQILALAAGGKTYKLKFGHRSQNQPCVEVGTNRCYITSQNHGYAVDVRVMPSGWEPWFINANDGTNEGIRHRSLPFRSVQFHPEAYPGPLDTGFLFDEFVEMLG
jgi:carbamoyl-phosphate synthase small subunit